MKPSAILGMYGIVLIITGILRLRKRKRGNLHHEDLSPNAYAQMVLILLKVLRIWIVQQDNATAHPAR